MFCC
ncbi:hypothetical protein D047_2679A, partial [Vibrio parahaemolyticus VPTS-2010_2]|jgi:hypothetical protein